MDGYFVLLTCGALITGGMFKKLNNHVKVIIKLTTTDGTHGGRTLFTA